MSSFFQGRTIVGAVYNEKNGSVKQQHHKFLEIHLM